MWHWYCLNRDGWAENCSLWFVRRFWVHTHIPVGAEHFERSQGNLVCGVRSDFKTQKNSRNISSFEPMNEHFGGFCLYLLLFSRVARESE